MKILTDSWRCLLTFFFIKLYPKKRVAGWRVGPNYLLICPSDASTITRTMLQQDVPFWVELIEMKGSTVHTRRWQKKKKKINAITAFSFTPLDYGNGDRGSCLTSCVTSPHFIFYFLFIVCQSDTLWLVWHHFRRDWVSNTLFSISNHDLLTQKFVKNESRSVWI